MDDIKEISIKPAKNGWLLEIINNDGGKEFELYEHDVIDEIDLSPDTQAHKLPAMCDMLVAVGRYFLQLDPESQETITVGIADRPPSEEEAIAEEVEEAIDHITDENTPQ